MTGIIKLTLAGINTGPFNLYSNIDGYISAFAVNITRAQLLTGYPTDAIPSLTTIIRIMSIGDCTNYIDVPLPNCLLIGTGVITIPPPTTTTTTTLPLTTTTTSTSTSTSTTTTTVIPTTTTTSSSTSTTTSTTTVIPTTTTTTTMAVINCGSSSSFSGGISYPTTQSVILGTTTGNTSLLYDAQSVPDRFIVEWNSSVVIDTGYRGGASYDFGGGSRLSFTNSLNGQFDPITLTSYPDLTNFPDDGYPRILGSGLGSTSFLKDLANDTSVIIKIYAPMEGTVWSYTLNCPGVSPTTTSTTTTLIPTTTTTTTPVVLDCTLAGTAIEQ